MIRTQRSGVTVNLAWLEDTPESLPKFDSLQVPVILLQRRRVS